MLKMLYRRAMLVTLTALTVVAGVGTAAAQVDRNERLREQFRTRLNSNTVSVVSGNPNGAYMYLAYDMSAVLDEGDNLRILPVIGKGGMQNVRDTLFLRGVDMGITQANVMTYLKRTGELGSDIDRRLIYITRLYNEEMHLVVAENSGINSVRDLEGKRVNFSDVGSGTQFSTRIFFETLKMTVTEVNVGQGDALQQLKAGTISATILVAGKPAGAFRALTPQSGYKILPLQLTPELEAADFLPTKLTSQDYGLIPQGQTVDTLAMSSVLAAYNWPAGSDKSRRMEKFIEKFFAKLPEFQKAPRHPKWKEVNLAATLPGWTRHPAAQAWLNARNR